jgi:hypothetical protein
MSEQMSHAEALALDASIIREVVRLRMAEIYITALRTKRHSVEVVNKMMTDALAELLTGPGAE